MCHNTLTTTKTPRHGLCHNTLTPTRKTTNCAITTHWHTQEHQGLGSHITLTPTTTPRLGLCHNTLTPTTAPRLRSNFVMHRIVTWSGISSAMTSSLYNSIHPPEMVMTPLKTACGYPTELYRQMEEARLASELRSCVKVEVAVLDSRP